MTHPGYPPPGYPAPHPGYQPPPGYQQPPPGYQQPPPGYQQAPPGYQQQPPPGFHPGYQPPPPGKPKTQKGTRLGWLIAGPIVVVVLIVVTTIWAVFGNSKTKHLDAAWQVPYATAYTWETRAADWLIGSWVVGDLVVRAIPAGLTGYRIADGAQAWNTPAPGGTTLCSVSHAEQNGLAVIAYGSASTCGTVGGIDLRSGKLTFAAPIKAPAPSGKPSQRDVPELGVTGTVAVSYLRNQIEAYALTDGKKLWSKYYGGDFCLGLYASSLAAGGDQVVVSRQCGRQSDNLAVLNAADGKEKWSSFQSTIYNIVSASPVVIHTAGATNAGDSVYVGFDSTGRAMGLYSEQPGGNPIVSDTAVPPEGLLRSSRTPYTVVGDILYAQVDGPVGITRKNGQVVAINLTTGQLKWSSTGHKSRFVVIRADDRGVLGLENGSIVLLPADTGKAELWGTAYVNGFEQGYDNDYYEVGGTLLNLTVDRNTLEKAVYAYR